MSEQPDEKMSSSSSDQALGDDTVFAKRSDEISVEQEERRLRREKADAIIKSNVIQAVAMGLIPAPILDVVSLINVQYKMTHDLAKLYDLHYQKVGKAVVRSFVLGVLPVVTVTGLSSLLKIMPGIGSFVGGASVSLSSGCLTYATGKVFFRHFEAGGTMDDFDLNDAKRQFRSELKKGRKEVLKLTQAKPQ